MGERKKGKNAKKKIDRDYMRESGIDDRGRVDRGGRGGGRGLVREGEPARAPRARDARENNVRQARRHNSPLQ